MRRVSPYSRAVGTFDVRASPLRPISPSSPTLHRSPVHRVPRPVDTFDDILTPAAQHRVVIDSPPTPPLTDLNTGDVGREARSPSSPATVDMMNAVLKAPAASHAVAPWRFTDAVWSLSALVCVIFGLVGLVMVLVAIIKLVDGEDGRNWYMAVVAVAGLVEIAMAVAAMKCLRRDLKLLAALCLFVAVWAEVLFIGAMTSFQYATALGNQVVVTILVAHGAVAAGGVVVGCIVSVVVRNTRVRTSRDAALVERLQAERNMQEDFRVQSPKTYQLLRTVVG